MTAIYNPPATDAVLINPDGSINGPLNPEIVAGKAECQALTENLRGAKVIPSGAAVTIQDEPWTEASTAIRYGKDGRRVFVLSFNAPDPKDPTSQVDYEENVEELYVWLKRAPYPQWQWERTEVDIIRVGGPSHPNPAMVGKVAPGQTESHVLRQARRLAAKSSGSK